MRRTAALAALAALLALGGCSLFGSDDDEPAGAAAAEPAAPVYDPVTEVRNIEIGRTRAGIVITVTGLAPGAGYAVPELRPRREEKPGPEGYLDYDFVARAPEGISNPPTATERTRMVRADRHVLIATLRGVRGIRIHAAEGGMMMNF